MNHIDTIPFKDAIVPESLQVSFDPVAKPGKSVFTNDKLSYHIQFQHKAGILSFPCPSCENLIFVERAALRKGGEVVCDCCQWKMHITDITETEFYGTGFYASFRDEEK
jgi:hypothetical protein